MSLPHGRCGKELSMKQKQKKAAKAVLSCLVLLLLYGCASHASGFYDGEADVSDADFSWTEGASSGAAKEAAVPSGVADKAADLTAAGTSAAGERQSSDGVSGAKNGQPLVDGSAGAADDVAPESGSAGTGTGSDTIAVYVCGAVKKPGVYELAAGSRVYEAVAMAGGMTKEASQRSVNQAGTLSDGQMIVILTDEEAEEASHGEQPNGAVFNGQISDGKTGSGDGRVNINTASAQELKSLPGIGDAKAAAIVAYREEHGAFSAAADIKKVSGIGESMFARLENLIRVD